jgi:molecular chaperone DnaK
MPTPIASAGTGGKAQPGRSLTFQAERVLREVVLDFGMQFARDRRRRIERLMRELREAWNRGMNAPLI